MLAPASSNKSNLLVGGIQRSPRNAGTDAPFVRGNGSTETKLLSGRLQSGNARHGDQTPAHSPRPRHGLQRLQVRPRLLAYTATTLQAPQRKTRAQS